MAAGIYPLRKAGVQDGNLEGLLRLNHLSRERIKDTPSDLGFFFDSPFITLVGLAIAFRFGLISRNKIPPCNKRCPAQTESVSPEQPWGFRPAHLSNQYPCSDQSCDQNHS